MVPSNVWKQLNKFQRLNFDLVDMLKTKAKSGRPRKVIGSPEINRRLLSQRFLKNWAHLSIYARSLKIKQLYGVHVPTETLRQFYRRNQLRFNVAKAEFYPYKKDLNQLQNERYEFAMKLSDFIHDPNVEVIYFDETSWHSRMVQRRAWWFKGQRFKVTSTQERGKGWTLFGAISPCLRGNAYFEIHHSTKGVYFEEFMTNIQARIRPEYRQKRLVLIADNHKAHQGEHRRALVEQFAELHFIPPYR